MTDITVALAILSDAELEGMVGRAWYRASRAWNEARNQPPLTSNSLRLMLVAEAESADDYWATLNRELSRRRALQREGSAA